MYLPCDWEHYDFWLWFIEVPLDVWRHSDSVDGLLRWRILFFGPILFGLFLMTISQRGERSLKWLFWRVFWAQLIWVEAFTVVMERIVNQSYYGMPYGYSWCQEIPFVIGLSLITGAIMTISYLACRIFSRAG